MTRTPSGVLDMAKNFLGSYQSYTGNSLYGELTLMLDKVNASKNSTTTAGNLKLTVNASAEYTTFSWRYTFNGIDARHKCVALGYKNGVLEYFVDTWDLYKIGSTAVNLSEEQAIALAMERAKKHSYTVGSGDDIVEVKDFNVTRAMVTQLIFCNSIHADSPRNADLLELYPMWRIGVGLDKFYPGNVYGIYVDIWADTQEVRQVEETFSTLPPELIGPRLFGESSAEPLDNQFSNETQLNSAPIICLIVLAVAIAIFGTVPVWVCRKKSSSRLGGLPKLRFSKFALGLLCILLSFALLLSPMSTAKAPTYRATIWGDRDFGYPTTKTANEQYRQGMIASNITSFFSDSGYSASNYQGDSTYKAMILSKIEDSEQNYDKAAIVYFDHGIGDWVDEDYDNWHYSVYDNDAVPVYDMDIYNRTQGKTYFAFINTCLSANMTYGQGHYGSGTAVGLPYAFTRNLVGVDMSSNGYSNPWGDSCYIGFPWGSASLSQQVDEVLYYDWVWAFFWFALIYGDVSVNYALNQASLMLYESNFDNTDLYNGFCPVWGTPWNDDDSTMVVYGNGNLHLRPKYNLVIQNSCGLDHTDPAVGTYEKEKDATQQIYYYTLSGWEFVHWTVNGGEGGWNNPLTVFMTEDKTVKPWFRQLGDYDITVYARDINTGQYGSVNVWFNNGPPYATTHTWQDYTAGEYHIKATWQIFEYPIWACAFQYWTSNDFDIDDPYDYETDIYVDGSGSITAWYYVYYW